MYIIKTSFFMYPYHIYLQLNTTASQPVQLTQGLQPVAPRMLYWFLKGKISILEAEGLPNYLFRDF